MWLGADSSRCLQGVYGGKVTDAQDLKYVHTLVDHVIRSCQTGASSLVLGKVTLPLPAANVDPTEYAKWFDDKMEAFETECGTVAALQLHSSVEMEMNEAK